MVHVLLTGGSGFIAYHVLEQLLERGHSVVTTVRSQAKADKIKQAVPSNLQSKLSFAIVEDIAQEGAFDKAIVSDPPFEAVIHTASPFHYNVTDVQKQLLDPAIIGTTGILKSIKAHAPSVKRVVITSSFAANLDVKKAPWPEHTYSEADWNPITKEEGLKDPASGYLASKKLAEKAAWDFVEKEKPAFTLTCLNPALVFGPVTKALQSLDSLNTSNEKIYAFLKGDNKKSVPETGTHSWVDVRDLGFAHVKAIEEPAAAGKRFLLISGNHTNRELVSLIYWNFPEYREALPSADGKSGGFPEGGLYGFDHSQAREVLGVRFRSFEESIVDTVKSLKEIGA